MREFSLFLDGDVLWGKEFMLIDGLVNTSGAQAIQSIQFDVGGKNVHGVVTVRDGNEEVKDVPLVFFIPLWSSTLLLPLSVSLVHVFLPVLVGGFQVSRMCLMLCQIFSSLLEYFKLFLIVVADFLVLARNSCQSLCNEEEFLPFGCPMSFESSAY